MEYLKIYYSLEKHLEETVQVNPQFETLNAIWKLNKKSLSAALANVNQFFPHYSLHEKSHSQTIIYNIESFLGEDRIKKLSPTDTWLLLMASFTHDLGMVVFYDLIENSYSSKEFQDFLDEVCDWDDNYMKESAEILKKLKNPVINNKLNNEEWLIEFSPIKIKNAFTVIVAEFMRRIHHKRSADIIKGIDKVFYQVANSFYSDQIPSRLLTVLGEVAYLHGVNFYDIFERLDYQANGVSSDKIHPRFIAAMLRLGDLLDVDDNRFNIFTEKVFEFPLSSTHHKAKHSSIIHFLITPHAIEITADCPNETVYRLARNWFDWLEREVELQSKEWTNITPIEIGGTSPQIPKGKIKVYYNGNKAPDQLLNLKFQISNEKIFQVIEGASIYENAGLTFIRELVQNALDASKIQLWTEIEKGTYDFAFRQKLGNPNLTHLEIIDSIKFPKDIPELLTNSFSINLDIKWENDDRRNLLFIVEDFGTGISDASLIRMTNKVGESRKKDEGYVDMLDIMPFWLKPTGAFGIGIQSVFIIVDSFKVETKADGEEAKEIIFRSARKGKYSSWSLGNKRVQRGTKITVAVPRLKFEEAFGVSFSWDIIRDYDYFTDDYGDIFIPKIRNYIIDTLRYIPSLQVRLMGKDLLLDYRNADKRNIIGEDFSDDKRIFCEMDHNENGLDFYYFESKIGTEYLLRFSGDTSDIFDDNWTKTQTKFFVRDIPVKSNLISYYRLYYSTLLWNFMSPESDKILSLTREKFINKYKKKLVENFFDNVIPDTIRLSEKILLDGIEEVKNHFKQKLDQLAFIYFKILLTKSLNDIAFSGFNNSILGDYDLPLNAVSRIDGNPCKMADFISTDKILFAFSRSYHTLKENNDYITQLGERLEEWKDHFNSTAILVKAQNFFYPYVRTTFTIEEILFSDNIMLFKMNKSISQISRGVKVVVGRSIYFKRFISSIGKFDRVWNYAIENLDTKIAVKNNYQTGFEDFPFLSQLSIISPFRDQESYNSLKHEISVLNNDREAIYRYLTIEKLRTFVTPALIKWIIENRVNTSELNENIIFEGYQELIADILIADM